MAQLLNGWKEAEDAFLRDRASGLRRDRRKAWNVYSIFLTPERAFAAQERDLVLVEENFQATRKIARAGIATDRDIENALGVLFPIRYRVSLRSENALGLVTSRLSALPSGAVRSLLDGGSGEELCECLSPSGGVRVKLSLVEAAGFRGYDHRCQSPSRMVF